MKCGNLEILVFLSCIFFLINFYSYFLVLHGILSHFLALIFISCGLFLALWRLHIPRPKEVIIKNFFGKDWGAYGSHKENPEDGFILNVIAHRACGLDTPENSLSALKAIHKEGIKAVEFDVMLTSDGVPIVFHDTNLSRMADVSREISQTEFEELRKIDISVKHPFGKNFPDEKIPTLYEYVTYCLENELRMVIDLKSKDDKIIQIIIDLFKQYPKMYELSVISSFNPILIYKIRSKDSSIICSVAWRPYFFSHRDFNVVDGPMCSRSNSFFFNVINRICNSVYEWALWKFIYYLLGISAILLHKDMITREQIGYWNNRGVRVIAWNVNLPSEKQYFEKILEISYLTDTVINS